MSVENRQPLRGLVGSILFILFFAAWLHAGVTGKIAGLVKDKETGTRLAGANVLIMGTTQGAAADLDGNFLIINVPPGTYKLRIQMVGFTPSFLDNVKVFSDRTTKVNVDLSQTMIEGKEVTVTAGREPVEFDRTNTTSYVRQEEIEALPVSTLSEVIQMQAGVVTDAGGGLHFRGGRSREVAYLIDGVPVTNSFSQGGGSNVDVENNFIKELQVITGTFNAEYGQAQSGVVNVITKVPEDKFHGSAETLTGGYYSPNKPQYIGLNSFDPLTEKEVKFSLSGPIKYFPKSLGKLGFFLNGRIVDSGGYLNGQRRFSPEDGWEITVFREWYQAIYDPEDVLIIPIPDSLHTGDGKTERMSWDKTINLNAKLVYQPFNAVTFAYNVFNSSSHGKGYSSSWRFCPEGTNQWWGDATTHIVTMTHVLRPNVFYNLRYSHQRNYDRSFMYESASDPRYQTNSSNAWDPGQITGYDFGGIESWERSWFKQSVNVVNGDLTWQINKVIEVKAGFDGKSHNLHYKNAPMREVFGYEQIQYPYTRKEIEEFDFTWNYFRDTTATYQYGKILLREASPDSFRDEQFYVEYDRIPQEASGYVQTKLEMGEIILNAGVRFDYFRPRDRYCRDYTIVYPELVGADMYYTQAKAKSQLSPRFGLSFPISERGALRLSYGHFFQIPSFEKMYQNPVLEHYNQYSIAGSRIGNPNLKPEKTIQYEIGLQQQLTNDLSFETSLYHKDIRNLLGIEILTLSNAATFYRYVNKEFGNSSGITVALNQGLAGGFISSRIDYTYMIAKGSASSPEVLRNISVLAGPGRGSYNLSIRKINYLDWDQTHTLNVSVNLRPTKKSNVSMIGQLGSGLPFSPATLDPSIELPGGEWDNTGRKPFRWEFDMRFSQGWKYAGFDWLAILKVFNVFNHVNENSVNAITGQAGPNAYLPEVALRRYARLARLGEFTRDEADYNPTWYSRPRMIQFGLQVGF
jgi:outer membrane receptor protein involved in Fe transport